jgi:pilus assembly protein TadC
MRVIDVPINPLYGVGERSKMVIHRTIPALLWLMSKLFLKRMTKKYIIRDFHPLIFFYLTSFLLFLISCPLVIRMLYQWILNQNISPIMGLATGFSVVMTLQFLFFAMWFDMDYNRDLNPRR